jgi:arylsulfatase A-like enzyme
MKRRQFLTKTALAAAAWSTASMDSFAASKKKPNVIVVLSDDIGYGDFSCHGNPILETPYLDRIAKEGMDFTDFHATPACAPSRGQLMTGLDCLHNLACATTAGRSLLRRNIPTMADLFRAEGYATGIFGKWHLGHEYPDRPMDKGFDKAIWFKGWGLQSEIEFDNDCINPRYLDGAETKRSKGYCTDLWFQEAISWMTPQKDNGIPFFAYIAPNVAHMPLWPPERYADMYKQVAPRIAPYYAMIANLDDNIGMLDEWMKKNGCHNDTIVVFMSDNGSVFPTQGSAGAGQGGGMGAKQPGGIGTVQRGAAGIGMRGAAGVGMRGGMGAGRRGGAGPGQQAASSSAPLAFNAGLRDGKFSCYDGGHRVACFLRYPKGGFKSHLQVSTPTQIQDILPTLLELCEIPPGKTVFDGVSLIPLMKQQQFPNRMFVVQFGQRKRPIKYDGAVICNQWRLVKGSELYDMAQDRAQQNDMAAKLPDLVKSMKDFYDAWWSKLEPGISAPIPMLVGTPAQNPVMLTSSDWWEMDVDNINSVSNAAGGPRGGVWNVQVESEGKYRMELRRWPFHTNMPIASQGPRVTVNGRSLTHPVKVIQPHEAILSVNGTDRPVSVKPEDIGAIFEVHWSKGKVELQGWFRDAEGKDLCGAFYALVTKLSS